MTANVRMFAFAGLIRAPAIGGVDLAYDSLMLTKTPYLGSQLLTPDTSAAVTSDAANAPDGTRLALIQVQNGKRVHMEVTPAGHALRTATTSSPIAEGNQYIEYGPGWRISVRESTE